VTGKAFMHLFKVLALATTALTGLSACVENDVSLFVVGILAADAPDCVYKADPGSDLRLSGTMDVGFTRTYSAVVLVANQLSPRGNKQQLRSETMGFHIRGGEVRLTDSTGNLIKEFSTPASGHSSPSTSNTPGYGMASLTLVPAEVGGDLAGRIDPGSSRTIIAEIRIFGTTDGGTEITSGFANYNIEVCHNCLRSFVEGGLEVRDDNYQYCNFALTEELASGCNPGQDEPTDCRLCQSSQCANDRF
jgi:hypothetical protein